MKRNLPRKRYYILIFGLAILNTGLYFLTTNQQWWSVPLQVFICFAFEVITNDLSKSRLLLLSIFVTAATIIFAIAPLFMSLFLPTTMMNLNLLSAAHLMTVRIFFFVLGVVFIVLLFLQELRRRMMRTTVNNIGG